MRERWILCVMGPPKEHRVGCMLIVKTNTKQKEKMLIFVWFLFAVRNQFQNYDSIAGL